MRIRFVWKPDYHAIQYLGATAIITVTGTDIAGSYRQKFTRKGLALDVGPVDLARRLQGLVGEGDRDGRRSAGKRHDGPDRSTNQFELRLGRGRGF